MRIGVGYDIHRLQRGRALVLGGVNIASEYGLEGHSDADVLLHALMDAVLGAACLGDIGHHFPPGASAYAGISSVELLTYVSGLVEQAHYRVVNVDMTLVAERPRIGPYVTAMRRVIAEALHIDMETVSVKATTNEGLGPEGRYEGMSAHAVALLDSVS